MDKTAVVVPTEAEIVPAIFTRYLELGSVQALAEDLERRGVRTKQRQLKDGRIIGGVPFGVGGLAHLLRNRFYIGEVVYRGETFRGDHEPILEPALFAAVQAKLTAHAVERRCRIRGLPALLTGRLFDEQGQRMTPTTPTRKACDIRITPHRRCESSRWHRSAACRRLSWRPWWSMLFAATCKQTARRPTPFSKPIVSSSSGICCVRRSA